MARPVVNDEPFAVLLADDFMMAETPVLTQMVTQYHRYQAATIAVQEIRPEVVSRYGIVEALPWNENVFQVKGIVEKPKLEDAPSTLGVVGRYILPSRIFDFLEGLPPGAGGEIQLSDAIASFLNEQQVLAYKFAGRRFDCGDKLGYLQAVIEVGLLHRDVGLEFTRYLDRFCSIQLECGHPSSTVNLATC